MTISPYDRVEAALVEAFRAIRAERDRLGAWLDRRFAAESWPIPARKKVWARLEATEEAVVRREREGIALLNKNLETALAPFRVRLDDRKAEARRTYDEEVSAANAEYASMTEPLLAAAEEFARGILADIRKMKDEEIARLRKYRDPEVLKALILEAAERIGAEPEVAG